MQQRLRFTVYRPYYYYCWTASQRACIMKHTASV